MLIHFSIGWVVVLTCFIFFLLGLSFCSPGGFYMFILFDDWSCSWNTILICLLEIVLVSWIYGTDKLFANIDEMGVKLQEATKIYFKICLRYIAPCLLAILLVTSWASSSPSKANLNISGKTYVFDEPGVQALAWLLGIFSISFIPIIGAWKVYQRQSTGQPIDRTIFQPSSKWKSQNDQSASSIAMIQFGLSQE